MPYCKKCGNEIDESVVFCPHCGMPVKASDVVYQRPKRPRWNVVSILAVFFGGLILLVSLGLLVGGGAVIWAQSTFSDSEGFMISRGVRFQSETFAMVFQGVDINMDVNIPAYLWTPKPSDFITIKLVGVSNDPSKDVFIGISREVDASGYLGGVEYDEVDLLSWSYNPWMDTQPRISYEIHRGTAPSKAPNSMTFWEASATGSGTQTLEWEPDVGSFWVVAMNADGSSDVDLTMQLGARIPILRTVGSMLLAGGFIVLIIGGLIIYFGAFRPRS